MVKGGVLLIIYKPYTDDLEDFEIENGFFGGWSNPPSKETHRKILRNSYFSLVAIDGNKNKIIGFINVISDGILSAYIPLLEVLPNYQNQGIGSELVKRVLEELNYLYMIDLCCDKELQPFYQRIGMKKSPGMIYRNYEYQQVYSSDN